MDYYLNLNEDRPISYFEKFDEYGIIIDDGTDSHIIISYCPWCGSKLPGSKRDEWFDQIESLGYEDPSDERIPLKYKTSAWYKESMNLNNEKNDELLD